VAHARPARYPCRLVDLHPHPPHHPGMDRRRFLLTSMAGAIAAPVGAEAQQAGKVRRIGFLGGTTVPELVEALRQGLRELGWMEGPHFVLEYRSANSKLEKVSELAAELVRSNVDVILVAGTALPYVKQATGNVPVVFVTADDPVSAGYVASFARPGGRMTGLTSLNVGLDAKRLEILKAALPGVGRVGVLSTPHDRARSERVAATERAARYMGLQVMILEVPRADLLHGAFDAASRARVGALMVLGSPVLFVLQGQIVDLARKIRLPVVSARRELPDAGGLMSYGTSVLAMYRRAATHVDRILKGANPGGLPVEQASTFEFVINMKTAKALGLTIPPSLLLRADQVIE
jgi:putative ABC transport system substrate-binding protein